MSLGDTWAVLALMLCGLPAHADPLVDRAAVFDRARAVAIAALGLDVGGEPAAALPGFRITYGLTLLETGDPDGSFEVDLLVADSRQSLPAAELLAAAETDEERARLRRMFNDDDTAWYYRTAQVRFTETGARPPTAEFSTLLLNRDPLGDASSEAARRTDATAAEPAAAPAP